MFNRNLTTQKKDNRAVNPWFSIQDEMRNLFNRFDSLDPFSLDVLDLTSQGVAFVPKVDIKDQGKNLIVTAEIPGMTEKDIEISLEEDHLILQGEKRNETKDEGKGYSEITYGSFYRMIPLRGEVDPDKVDATYRDGVLKVTLNKRPEAQSKVKKIAINQKRDVNLDVKH